MMISCSKTRSDSWVHSHVSVNAFIWAGDSSPLLLLEEDVVGGVGVEGRVEVYEIDRLVGDILPEYVEVVAVVEGVRHFV